MSRGLPVDRGLWTVVICQRLTVHRRQQIGFVETKCTITTIDGGPLTVNSGQFLLSVRLFESL